MTTGNRYSGTFCSPDEKQITTLGTGYVANFLSAGEVEASGATLTNKRIYFSGKSFMLSGDGKLSSAKERKIVAVRDITGVGYKQFDPIHYIVSAVLALIAGFGLFGMTGSTDWYGDWQYTEVGLLSVVIGVAVAVVLVTQYFMKRRLLMNIEYAGGNIAYDVSWFQTGEQDIFIRNIHLAKDKIYSRAAAEQGFATSDPTNEQEYVEDCEVVGQGGLEDDNVVQDPVRCTQCDRVFEKTRIKCPHCGEVKICLNCGNFYPAMQRSCTCNLYGSFDNA
jgi:predicted Zn-ribbon and HTH transcriptional regulator